VVTAAVIGFGTSTSLMAAYGIAVMGTMLATTFLTFFVIRYYWAYPLWFCLLATGFFALIEAALLAAALHKVFDGGWLPLSLGAAIFVLMITWRRGREILFARLSAASVPLQPFLKSLFAAPPARVAGTAVFLTADPESTPHALLHSLKHYRVLHERVVFLTVKFRDVPWVPFADRVKIEPLGQGCWRVEVRYGFMNRPDVMPALELCAPLGLAFDPMETSFFLSREKIVPIEREGGMALWRERLFAAMARNAGNVTDYFNIPPNRVVELGTRVEI
jgi:KUP system potassium uptake protein